MPFVKSITAGYVLFCVPKENQKGRRCPQGMKAPDRFAKQMPRVQRGKVSATFEARVPQLVQSERGGNSKSLLLSLYKPPALC